MGEFTQVLKGRRSIRRFTDEPVSDESVNAILEAVRWSPSWANTQCWEIIVVKDQGVKERLAETLPKGNPAKKGLLQAPVVLGVAGRLNESGSYKGQVTTKLGDWYLFDLGIATQSILLAAADQGLGTVVVGLYDLDAAAAVLNIPAGVQLVSLIPVGHPAKESLTPKRKEIAEFIHHETY